MNTLDFLKLILPESGVKYLMFLRPRRNGTGHVTAHAATGDIDDLADKILQYDKRDDTNVYFAMASYKEVIYKEVARTDGSGTFSAVVGRTQDNVREVKSLWLDLDVGKDGCYESQQEAAKAVAAYAKAVGLPAPLYVSSGYGVHCYWPFSEPVTPQEWEGIAKYQRAAWRHFGLKADPACDQDCARVLRTPGTHNRRASREPKLVRVLSKSAPQVTDAATLRATLKAYVEANDVEVPIFAAVPDWVKNSGEGALSLFNEIEHSPSYAPLIQARCNQVKVFAETGGVNYLQWWHMAGLLKHCVDGEAYYHKWSSMHVDYEFDASQKKLDEWDAKATRCNTFAEDHPEGCAGCEFRCNSPIALGYNEEVIKPVVPEAVAEPEVVQAPVVDETPVEPDAENVPFGWPKGFGYNNRAITKKVRNEDGTFSDAPIAEPLFYPVEQIRDVDGTLALRCHSWPRAGRLREFNIPQKLLGDKRGLGMHLSAHGVHPVGNSEGVRSFAAEYAANLQRAKAETETYRQMGWKHDFKAFLIGDTLVTPDGTRKVMVSKDCADLVGICSPTGDVGSWVRAVDDLYNREHGEPYQFAICAAFAAPLHDLLGFPEWRGIPYALTTNDSGYGKSTVNKIAHAIWCNPEKSTIAESTPKATLSMASSFNNVPFLLDEVTQYLKDPADMASVLYAMSNGRPRHGMGGDGKRRDALPHWTGCCAMTGNRNILLQLAENKLTPEATQMRVFEIDLDTYPRLTTMQKGHRDYKAHYENHSLLSRTIPAEHHSIIGPEYVQFIMRNLPEVRSRLRATSLAFAKLANGDGTKERFYYHLVTTVLVGAYYAKKLGYINFNINNLRDWCIQHIKNLRGNVRDHQRGAEDMFAALLSEASGHLIVTKNFDSLDIRKGRVEEHKGAILRTPIAGRYVLGDEKERTKLYITVDFIRQWCANNGVSIAVLRRQFEGMELLRHGTPGANRATGAVRVQIGKGVHGKALGSPWCWELDTKRATGITSADNVESLDAHRAEPEKTAPQDEPELVVEI